jgi:O-antigen/teichoic acid export membrane protein
MILLPSSFYEFIFGAGFGGIRLVIQALAPGVLFLNLNIIISHYFSGIGKYQLNSIASFAGLVIAIPLFSWMIPAYGLWGAGLASSISYIFTSLIILEFFKKESSMKWGDLFNKTNVLSFKSYK